MALTPDIVVGIGEWHVSNRAADLLVTYSLGSCVGLSFYDPAVKVGGLIHCQLPEAKLSPEKAVERPAMFVDTGVPRVLKAMYRRGAKRERLVVKMAGGSNILDEKRLFQIGRRNYTMATRILWQEDILLTAEHVGGSVTRTLYLRLEDGASVVRCNGRYVRI
jgi:chemotaxis protein CheD